MGSDEQTRIENHLLALRSAYELVRTDTQRLIEYRLLNNYPTNDLLTVRQYLDAKLNSLSCAPNE